METTNNRWLTQDALLLSLSAFFADLGYQGVTALFPLFLVLELHQPVYLYGLFTALSFGAGSMFAYLGGKAGDKVDKKTIAILGNIFIPFMSFSGLSENVFLCGTLFVLGWWARYFRTPARRALLVQVSPHEYRAKVFGFLHALDITGGMLSALFALLFLALHLPIGTIILFSLVPLLISSAVLLPVKRTVLYMDEPSTATEQEKKATQQRNQTVFIALLAAATLYGFSFYNLGYPILTVATVTGKQSYSHFLFGVLTYAIYLGVSAISGYTLGAAKVRPLRSLWLLGYLPSALASLLIGISYVLHLPVVALYVFVAVLGLGMGAAETFEPTLTSLLVQSTDLSSGMGWLSVSRSIGQFLSNLIMGLLFALSQFASYFYAFAAAFIATAILLMTEVRARKLEKADSEATKQA
jgi:MFS family permease